MKRKRVIYIDPALAKEACGSKESLEALAVTLSIKTMFVNSVMREATATRAMRALRIGHARYHRAVGHALRRGWLRRDGGSLVAGGIKTPGAYNVRLVLDRCHYDGKRGKGDEVRARYTLTELCDYIRQAVLLFHISKQNTVHDTLTMATRPAQGQGAAMRAARKRLRRWGMRERKLRQDAERLSYARMSELVSTSRSKAKRLMRPLVRGGVVRCQANFMPTPYNIRSYRPDKGAALRSLHAGMGLDGCVVYHDGLVCVRLANSYSLLRTPVRFKFAKTAI